MLEASGIVLLDPAHKLFAFAAMVGPWCSLVNGGKALSALVSTVNSAFTIMSIE
jgi:hypothetical protein